MCVTQPIFSAIDTTVAHPGGVSRSGSKTILAARSGASGATLLVALRVMAPAAHGSEAPTGRGVSLMGSETIYPVGENGFEAEVVGSSGLIASATNENSPCRGCDRGCSVTLVAGTGFEPVTFRL